jgi:dolichyl-diphosphooligosaccharide--protein glycosyltransferase
LDPRNWITKDNLMNILQNVTKLRVPTSRTTLLTVSAVTVILFVAFSVRLLPTHWGLELSEFDPYFQYRFTEHIVNKGYFGWTEWYDIQRWYPIGYNVDISQKAFPGLPLTAATLYNIVSSLGVPISLYHLCVIFPAIFGALACLMAYFLGNDIGGKAVGLFSALFLTLNSSHITRTAAGFFDDETVGIGAILLFAFLFLRSLDKDRSEKHSVIYAIAAGLALGYINSAWGAALYPIAMTALFVFALILIKRYSRRLLISYSLTFGLGLFLAINVPKLSLNYLTTIAILPVLGVFGLLCLCEVVTSISFKKWKLISTITFIGIVIVSVAALSYSGQIGTIAGKFIRVVDPLQRETSQIYQSVQEHRVTAWGSIYYDYGVGVLFFALGLFFTVRTLTNRNLFTIIFGITALYFACSMVRLTILLAPVFGILMAIGIVNLLKPFVTILKQTPRISLGKKRIAGLVGKEFSGSVLILTLLLLTSTYAFPRATMYEQADMPMTILAASMPIRANVEIWIDAFEWMTTTYPEGETIICSWWDYGYWITIRGNQTSLADNATFNTTQIALIGRVFMSDEAGAMEILQEQFTGPRGPPTHILAFFTFYTDGVDRGYGDEGKWYWMARIGNSDEKATSAYGEFFTEEDDGSNTFGSSNQTDDESSRSYFQWNEVGRQTVLYKMMAAAKADCGASGNYWPIGNASVTEEFTYFKNSTFFTVNIGGDTGIYASIAIFEIDYPQVET